MSNRNTKFLFGLFVVALAVGYLVDWWLVAGLLLGVALAVYIYQRRYSVVDELETETHWYVRGGWKNAAEEGDEFDGPQWRDGWRFGLVILLVVIVAVATVIGLVM